MFDDEYNLAKAVMNGMTAHREAGEYALEHFMFNRP